LPILRVGLIITLIGFPLPWAPRDIEACVTSLKSGGRAQTDESPDAPPGEIGVVIRDRIGWGTPSDRAALFEVD